jgi:hypothetical protein
VHGSDLVSWIQSWVERDDALSNLADPSPQVFHKPI